MCGLSKGTVYSEGYDSAPSLIKLTIWCNHGHIGSNRSMENLFPWNTSNLTRAEFYLISLVFLYSWVPFVFLWVVQ